MGKSKITVEVKHSRSKNAWNILGTKLGAKYKIAIVPYVSLGHCEIQDTKNKAEALEHAELISFCFNNQK